MTVTRSREGTVRMAEMPRVVPFLLRDAAGPGDGNTLDGYASVFNAITIIDSWEGRFKEQFLSGSMKKSFRDQTPIIQFDHGRHPLIGSLPVAHFDPGYPREETDPERAPDGGAHVVAQLHQSPLFEPVREVISTGTVNGMSIRFAPTKERWYWPDGSQVKNNAEIEAELYRTWREVVPDEELLRRDITEASVAEMGPVVWPAYATTSVGVRSILERLDTDERKALIRELSAELRRSPDLTDLIAASSAQSTDGDDDAERQAVEASPGNTHALNRARVLSLRGL
jgi:phage head maturation protease